MPKRYAREFRRAICERLVAGERISKVSNESGVSEATLHRWRDQALIDAGLKPGTKSVEVDEHQQQHPSRPDSHNEVPETGSRSVSEGRLKAAKVGDR